MFLMSLRPLINAIEGYTMLLQGEELSPDQEEYVEKILFNTQRLSGLVGNILLLSKLENQNIPMKKQNIVWMNRSARHFFHWKQNGQKKEIGFQVELEESNILGMKDFFMHIWINLLDNAIKVQPFKGDSSMFLKQEQDSVKFILEDEDQGIEDDVNPETRKEKLYHVGISGEDSCYNGILFFFFVSIFSILFGNENKHCRCSSLIMSHGV